MERVLDPKVLTLHLRKARTAIEQSKAYRRQATDGDTIDPALVAFSRMADEFLKLAEEQILMAELYIVND
jgi:hypothetical protein